MLREYLHWFPVYRLWLYWAAPSLFTWPVSSPGLPAQPLRVRVPVAAVRRSGPCLEAGPRGGVWVRSPRAPRGSGRFHPVQPAAARRLGPQGRLRQGEGSPGLTQVREPAWTGRHQNYTPSTTGTSGPSTLLGCLLYKHFTASSDVLQHVNLCLLSCKYIFYS